MLDMATGLIALFVLLWVTTVCQLAAAASRSDARSIGDLVYTVVDGLILAGLILVLLRPAKFKFDPRLLLGKAPVRLLARSKGGMVVFEVHDSGAGVPARHNEDIWEAFEKGRPPTQRATPGHRPGPHDRPGLDPSPRWFDRVPPVGRVRRRLLLDGPT